METGELSRREGVGDDGPIQTVRARESTQLERSVCVSIERVWGERLRLLVGRCCIGGG